ncbi:MAG: hypothetical protein FJ298_14065 [Planctomycetes bacterium]|nr:hypothetical protein [Planctomycetota bacterium]
MAPQDRPVLLMALLPTAGLCLVALSLVVLARGRISSRVGGLLASERAPRLWLRLAFTLAALTLVAIVVHWEDLPGGLALFTLLVGVVLLAKSPLAQDADVGERGVRRGWSAREYAHIEEWRLTGEHLRWRVRGEWRACRVPLELHAALRARLQAACAQRESPFRG